MNSPRSDNDKLINFSGPLGFRGPLSQTIYPYFRPHFSKPPPGKHNEVQLPDGDRLIYHWSEPKGWTEGQRIILLIHGLGGSENSHYMVRLARKFYNQGYAVARLNLRSCGPGMGLALLPYHSGRSEDTLAVLNEFLKLHPQSPVTQIGFSLSGNITLKMLGEAPQLLPKNLDSAIAVSPPADLAGSAKKITQCYGGIFDRYFVNKLKREVNKLHIEGFKQPAPQFPKNINLIDFDELYTAPRSGFDNAMDYYAKASSLPFLQHIQTPTLIIHSVDDPVAESRPIGDVKKSKSIQVLETQFGGHMGYWDYKGYWLDRNLLNWVGQRAKNN